MVKISAPSSTGGIIRYFDEYKSKVEISPGKVLFITLILIIVIISLHVFNPFGF
ncbi:MAG: preprotein translocase subunit Sec61beta [Nanoarchaeota archaeon]|nr:preprotein translocase subunit Sec61beta [Nanoarchaeota archaeon]